MLHIVRKLVHGLFCRGATIQSYSLREIFHSGLFSTLHLFYALASSWSRIFYILLKLIFLEFVSNSCGVNVEVCFS